jgi:hypothetical protein
VSTIAVLLLPTVATRLPSYVRWVQAEQNFAGIFNMVGQPRGMLRRFACAGTDLGLCLWRSEPPNDRTLHLLPETLHVLKSPFSQPA